LPIDAITFKEASLHFEMKLIGAVYEGALNREGTEISGQWKQSNNVWPLVFKRSPAESK